MDDMKGNKAVVLDVNKENMDALYKIAEHQFVKQSMQSIVFNKLFLDGYVCCSNGLYPSNKESLIKRLSQNKSRLCPIIEKNANSYQDLLQKINIIGDISNYKLTTEEKQSVVYAIIETKTEKSAAFCIFSLLEHYFGKTRFHLQDNFIIADDVKLLNIESFEEFVSALQLIPEKINVLYRGHSNINYSIQPSLFRFPKYYKNEYMMYQEMVIRCPDYFISCSSHLDFLVEMQHYGLPTRLLDFTFNPLVALYFACESLSNTGEIIIYTVHNSEIVYGKDEKAVILSCLPMLSYKKQKQLFDYLSNGDVNCNNSQEELTDEIKIERPSFSRNISLADIRMPIFVKPPRINKRIAHQEGAFLLWGLDRAHYDETITDDFVGDQEKYRFKVNEKKMIFYVQQKNKEKILKDLNRMGVNKAFLYPEIDDVADYLKSTIEE